MNSVDIAFDQISDIVGKDNFIQNEETLSFYSTDVFVSSKEKPLAVVRPNNSYELIKIVQACIANNVSLIVRGGGASYTGGYLPINSNTIIIDSQNLKKIEINDALNRCTQELIIVSIITPSKHSNHYSFFLNHPCS